MICGRFRRLLPSRDAFVPTPMARAAGAHVHRVILAPVQLGNPQVGARFEHVIEASGIDGQVVGRLGNDALDWVQAP